MAALYNLEPQPTAKVVLTTTSGDLALELFAKQTPLASRNFLQHCLDGYYNGIIFHRLVPGFIIQGGDPKGTGQGGEAAINNGEAFEDEIHSRLKFNRRGLLGMANEGKDSNGSQFFLTLGATPELQGKHTMFGRIEGDTIYNLMKMSEAELTEEEGSERPLYPTKITGAEVLVNPFEDMVVSAKRDAPKTERQEVGKKELKKRKKQTGKNVLSFGGDDGEDEDIAPVLKKAKANPKFVATAEEEAQDNAPVTTAKEKKAKRVRSPSPVAPTKDAAPPVRKPTHQEPEPEISDEEEPPSQAATALEQTNAEIAALKGSMKRNVDSGPKHREKPKSALEALIPEKSIRGRKRGKVTDEKGALDMFNAFKRRLDGIPDEAETNGNGIDRHASESIAANVEPTTSGDAADDDDEANLCDLHFIANCQSCKAWDEEKPDEAAEADGDDDPGWMKHRLTFARDTLGKDLEWKRKMEEIEVIDPREKARELQKERREKGKAKVSR